MLPCDTKGFLTRLAHRHAIDKQANLLQHNPFPHP